MKIKNLLIGVSVSVLIGMTNISQAESDKPFFGGDMVNTSGYKLTLNTKKNHGGTTCPGKFPQTIGIKKEGESTHKEVYTIFITKKLLKDVGCQIVYNVDGDENNQAICTFLCEASGVHFLTSGTPGRTVTCRSGEKFFDLAFIGPNPPASNVQ